MAQQLEEVSEVQRTEWLHDESGGSDCAGKGSSLRIITCREEDDADISRLLRRFELTADRVAVATVAFEGDIQEKDLWTVTPDEREALVWRRCFDDLPALGGEGHSSEGPERGIVVGDDDGGFLPSSALGHAATVSPTEPRGK